SLCLVHHCFPADRQAENYAKISQGGDQLDLRNKDQVRHSQFIELLLRPKQPDENLDEQGSQFQIAKYQSRDHCLPCCKHSAKSNIKKNNEDQRQCVFYESQRKTDSHLCQP